MNLVAQLLRNRSLYEGDDLIGGGVIDTIIDDNDWNQKNIIVGEEKLVNEWTALCNSKGFIVEKNKWGKAKFNVHQMCGCAWNFLFEKEQKRHNVKPSR